jgi:glycolate oxidase FAD binding subunit
VADLLLGTQFANGRGELITAGGRTVKNVAGYDLTKFVVGQHGAFARLVTLTTRTYRRPAGAVVAAFDPSVEKAAELLPSPLRPQWMALTAGALLCGYVGDERTLAFYRDRLPTVGPRSVEERPLDADVDHRRSLWCSAEPQTFRASVPPSKVIEFARQARLDHWSADAAFGVVVGGVPAAGPAALVAAADAVGGAVTLSDRSADPPRTTFSRISPPERALLARLKQAFDPDGALAPLPS